MSDSTARPTTTDADRRDRLRAVCLLAAAVGQIAVSGAAPLLSRARGRTAPSIRDEVEPYETAITPPGYAFAIWGPIYAGCAAHAVQHALPRHRGSTINRLIGWPLTAAYTVDAAWVLATQTGRFRYTPAILPVGTACAALAYRRLQRTEPTGTDRLASVSTGLLLGWTSLATTVNLCAATRLAGADPRSRASIVGCAGAAAATAAAMVATTLRSRQGFVPLAAAVAWGLGTTAAHQARPALVRAVAGVATAGVVGAAATRVVQRRGRRASGVAGGRSVRPRRAA